MNIDRSPFALNNAACIADVWQAGKQIGLSFLGCMATKIVY